MPAKFRLRPTVLQLIRQGDLPQIKELCAKEHPSLQLLDVFIREASRLQQTEILVYFMNQKQGMDLARPAVHLTRPDLSSPDLESDQGTAFCKISFSQKFPLVFYFQNFHRDNHGRHRWLCNIFFPMIFFYILSGKRHHQLGTFSSSYCGALPPPSYHTGTDRRFCHT